MPLYHLAFLVKRIRACQNSIMEYWSTDGVLIEVTHICVHKLTIIGSDNGLSSGRHKAIICTDAGILLIGPWGTNFNDIIIEVRAFSLNRIRLKMSSANCCPIRLGLNGLSQTTKHFEKSWRYSSTTRILLHICGIHPTVLSIRCVKFTNKIHY